MGPYVNEKPMYKAFQPTLKFEPKDESDTARKVSHSKTSVTANTLRRHITSKKDEHYNCTTPVQNSASTSIKKFGPPALPTCKVSPTASNKGSKVISPKDSTKGMTAKEVIAAKQAQVSNCKKPALAGIKVLQKPSSMTPNSIREQTSLSTVVEKGNVKRLSFKEVLCRQPAPIQLSSEAGHANPNSSTKTVSSLVNTKENSTGSVANLQHKLFEAPSAIEVPQLLPSMTQSRQQQDRREKSSDKSLLGKDSNLRTSCAILVRIYCCLTTFANLYLRLMIQSTAIVSGRKVHSFVLTRL